MAKNFTKWLALAATVVGVIFSGTLAAESDELLYSGTVDVSFGTQYATETQDENGVDLNNGNALTAAGRGVVNIPLASRLSAQLEVQSEFYNRSNGDSSGTSDPQGAHMLGGHLSLRNPGMGLVGLFSGVGMGINSDSDGGGVGWLAGLEAQYYLGNFTIYGQGGYANFHVDEENEGFNRGVFGGLETRYFFTDNIMLNVNGAYGRCFSCIDGEDIGDTWQWGAGTRIRISDSMPIYVTADYRGGNYYNQDEGGDEAREHAILLGFSFGFGATSLKENDRHGATLTTPMLPARYAAWTETLD